MNLNIQRFLSRPGLMVQNKNKSANLFVLILFLSLSFKECSLIVS